MQVCVMRDIDFMCLCECVLVSTHASLHAYVCVSLSLSTLLWWGCAGMYITGERDFMCQCECVLVCASLHAYMCVCHCH